MPCIHAKHTLSILLRLFQRMPRTDRRVDQLDGPNLAIFGDSERAGHPL
jgi:hypothetical protein